MRKTKNQQTLRGDIDFIIRLNRIRAEKEIREGVRISIPDLTREMINCNAFLDLEKELIEKKLKSRLKMDRRRLW